jgi:two-component system, chemotaxis family, chemotaxis protein CheY
MFSHLKVLVVDENEKMRSLIVDLVKRKTEDVLECSNGMDALGEYSLHSPDLVFMDVNLKAMDGFAATGLIHEFYPKANVIIVSNENTPKLKAEAHRVGASAFISKDSLPDILNYLNR